MILPDQDVLNALYGDAIRCIPNEKYNVDMRLIKFYEIQSLGQLNPDWMIDQACLLHFCGNNKPWQEGANGSWEILYKQYARLASKLVEDQPATDGQFNSNAVL